MNIRMFPMGFGESIFLHTNHQGLLIDCGSESNAMQLYFDQVSNEIGNYDSCSFMLSHFHEDHYNGLIALLDNNHHFDMVYIPHVFTNANNNYHVDFLIMEYLLNQIRVTGNQQTYYLWDLLLKLVKSHHRIRLLRRGDQFHAVGENFTVLWPEGNTHTLDARLYNALVSKVPGMNLHTQTVHVLAGRLCQFVNRLVEYGQGDGFDNAADFLADDLQELIDDIHEQGQVFQGAFLRLNKLTDAQINTMLRNYLPKINIKKNDMSIVCQTTAAQKPLLLTGDVEKGSMRKIAHNFDGRYPLLNVFYAIKAPHHGTESHYFNFGAYVQYQYMLISNGETTRKNRGLISAQYNLLYRNYHIHCTNTQQERCECLNNPKIFQNCCCHAPNCACQRAYTEI